MPLITFFGRWCKKKVLIISSDVRNCRQSEEYRSLCYSTICYYSYSSQDYSYLAQDVTLTHSAGVNFIHILCAIFLYDSALGSFSLVTFGFVIFWQTNIRKKGARKMLMKLTTDSEEDKSISRIKKPKISSLSLQIRKKTKKNSQMVSWKNCFELSLNSHR